ncbi:MAG: hypothetical protein PHW00_01385 [Clostridia bacterium]|nr:hypothetical protein [Clostridia bacterium]
MGRASGVLGAICVIIGGVIGVGFATGKEILLFFHGANAYVIGCTIFVLLASLTFLFLYCARTYCVFNTRQLFGRLFGKFYFLPDWLLIFSYYALMSTMLAGANLCLCGLFNMSDRLPVFSLATAVICGWVLTHNMNGLKALNIIIVPFIIIFVLFVTFMGEYAQGVITVKNTFSYSCFNVFMMCGILLPLAQDMSIKQCLISAIVSAFILSLLLTLILIAINNDYYANLSMPLIYLAKEKNHTLFVMSSIVLYLAIVTTLVANAFPLIDRVYAMTDSKFLSVFIVMSCGLVTSLFGFERIVDTLYPFMAQLGTAIIVIMTAFLLKDKITAIIKHKGSCRQKKTPATHI